jgi:hypothetical protein
MLHSFGRTLAQHGFGRTRLWKMIEGLSWKLHGAVNDVGIFLYDNDPRGAKADVARRQADLQDLKVDVAAMKAECAPDLGPEERLLTRLVRAAQARWDSADAGTAN